MQLPHIKQPSSGKPSLGKQSLRAITQPIAVSRSGRQTGLDLATDFLFDQTMPVP